MVPRSDALKRAQEKHLARFKIIRVPEDLHAKLSKLKERKGWTWEELMCEALKALRSRK